MRSRYKTVDSEGIYFLTSTIIEWIPIFTTRDRCDIVIDSLAYCRRTKGLRVYAYVIMENHIHLVAEAPELSRVMQSFKRHTAKSLIEHVKNTNQDWLVHQLAFYKKRYKESSTYQVWQEGFHPQLIQGDEMLRQKIAYIHENPVRRGYVDAPEEWRYSSARNYRELPDAAMVMDKLSF